MDRYDPYKDILALHRYLSIDRYRRTLIGMMAVTLKAGPRFQFNESSPGEIAGIAKIS